MPSTTQWPRASSAPCSSSCWTADTGRPERSLPRRSLSTSKPSTTREGVTPRSATSALSSSKHDTPIPQLRHDQLSQPVRRTGGSSALLSESERLEWSIRTVQREYSLRAGVATAVGSHPYRIKISEQTD